MMQDKISINICGDFYINTISPDENYFPEKIIDIFRNSELNIVNLECPVACSKGTKINKTGPHISASPLTFYYLNQIHTTLVTLATNHLMDFGREGLLNTLLLCKENSIESVGAGISLKEATKPYFFDSGPLKISVLNFTENEWSVAGDSKAGANPFDIVENIRQIRKAKELSDFVMVIIHGGNEFYHLPNPRMVSNYRFLAENGASVIIGHHPHCISGYEVYKGVPIFYSLGNFLFTMRSARDPWYTGLILNINFSHDKSLKWKLIPVKQCRETFTLSLPSGSEKQNIHNDIEKYSAIIVDDVLLKKNWENFVNEKFEEKIDFFSPIQLLSNRDIIKVFQKTGMNRLFRTKKHFSQILNHIRCESLYELSKSIITKYLEK